MRSFSRECILFIRLFIDTMLLLVLTVLMKLKRSILLGIRFDQVSCMYPITVYDRNPFQHRRNDQFECYMEFLGWVDLHTSCSTSVSFVYRIHAGTHSETVFNHITLTVFKTGAKSVPSNGSKIVAMTDL